MAKIKIDSGLFSRAKRLTEAEGYSSVEEFVTHIIEREISRFETTEGEKKVADRLRGLGYIE